MFRDKTVHLALSFVFYSSLTVFGQWSAATSGTTDNLNGVYLLDSGIGFAVGDAGTILKTTDAGMTWSPVTSGTTNTLHDVYFFDATQGIAVGEQGLIRRTTDGGGNWQTITSGVEVTLRSVAFSGVNGISGGYTGKGFKTVIASQAFAKVSFRLVDKQDPEKIRAAFRAYVQSKLPADCSVEFTKHGGSPGIRLSADNPALVKTRAALTDEWGNECMIVGSGGSIPVAGDFKTVLGLDALMVGFAQENDRIHSPNEKYNLASFHGGIRSWARILAALSEEVAS